MNERDLKRNRITKTAALLLSALMVLTEAMCVPLEAYAWDGAVQADDVSAYEADGNNAAADDAEAYGYAVGNADFDDLLSDSDDAAHGTDAASYEGGSADEHAADAEGNAVDPDAAADAGSADNDAADTETENESTAGIQETAVINVTAVRNADRTIVVGWEPVKKASYYIVIKGSDSGIRVEKSSTKTDGKYTCTFDRKIKPGKNYKFTVKAYNKKDELLAGSELTKIKAAKVSFNGESVRTLANKTIKPKKLKGNLTKKLGEGRNGYSVVQGGCTDGKYAYYLMVSSYTQKGRVLKINISDPSDIKRSGIIDICHGNGMAYDSDRHRLVVVGRESRRSQLTLIDSDTLEFIKYKKVNYSKAVSEKWGVKVKGSYAGLSAISYVRRYDCYVALQRTTHDLLVLDPSFNVIGFIGTKITAKYPGTYQAMDADDKYVYLLLSYYSSAQPYNKIICLDWNSENLLDYINGNDDDFAREWKCNDNNSGRPDAAIRIKTPYEAENIYHTTNSKGKEHFYLSEYYNNPKYTTVTKQVAYKVKWKKVTKKVKWKKVKGKWKYKKVKVWKYKTKYKTVKEKVVQYYRRHNYVYDLGTV